jgi:BirA family transcriptional regulator, biotin operon repressor / biotin---[acetyl-CoA-carboxylase] ligase
MGCDPLDQLVLRDELQPPWRALEVVEQTGSTNADLLAKAADGIDIDGLVRIAEHQTAGRGRSGRSWSTPRHAQIALSVGVNAAGLATDTWGWLPLAAGVAVIDAVAGEAGVEAGLKWPNDVLADGGKLAGILAEVAAPKPMIVVGVGLNVTPSDEVDDPGAISLADLGVAAPDRQRLVTRLLSELGRRIAQWRAGDQQLMADYRACSLTIGAAVRAILPGDREIVGTARSVDDQGRLCIQSEGRIVELSAGDVVHIRPTRRPGP